MDLFLWLLALLLCLVASFIFSGSETGIYTLSRVRVDMQADQGHRPARMVRMLLRDESALLITILIGNNLAIELASYVGDHLLGASPRIESLDPAWRALLLTLVLTPLLFMLGEALPKELYRRRAHSMVYPTVPLILIARWVLWPFERVLRLLTASLEHLFGLGSGRVASGGRRERLIALLAEGRRHGALHERAEALARNALQLRTLPVTHAMVPWDEVQKVNRTQTDEELHRLVSESRFTRLPVVDEDGRLEGYVHQLEVLAAGAEIPVLSHLRRVSALPADTPVDRAILHLRGEGRRGAVVGSVEEPLGWVTLKDLVEEISGEVVGL